MNQDDVLKLIREEADKLDKTHIRQSDTIFLPAQVIANFRKQLSKKSFDVLEHIGATIYKTCLSQDKARSEVVAIMRESPDLA
jgi:hypothetical protein